jgi:hypothetical protein
MLLLLLSEIVVTGVLARTEFAEFGGGGGVSEISAPD